MLPVRFRSALAIVPWGVWLSVLLLLVTAARGDSSVENPSDVGEEPSAFVPPAELLAQVEKSKQRQFQTSLRSLLKEGMSADGAAAAKKHYESAHQAVSNDPRAPFAYGLALLEQKNYKEALVQFQAALKLSPGDYLPAFEARAYTELQRREYSSALNTLKDLSRRLESTKGTWPSEFDRIHTAEWLGRTVGFLEGPGAPSDQKSPIAETLARISEGLTADRKSAFEKGRASVAKRHAELEAWSARPVNEIAAELRTRRTDAEIALNAAQEDLKQFDKQTKAIKSPYEKQIADGSSDIRDHHNRLKNAQKEIPAVEEKVEFYSIPQSVPNGVNKTRGVPTSVRMRGENAQEKKARETNLANARQKLDQLQTTISNAKQAMADTRKQVDQAKAEMRSALAKRLPERRDVEQKVRDCTNRLRDLEHAALSPDQIKSRASALEAYVPFDTFTARDRLLETLKSN